VYPENYDIHVNFPGGVALDGPSARIGIVTAIYSAITELPVDNMLADDRRGINSGRDKVGRRDSSQSGSSGPSRSQESDNPKGKLAGSIHG